MPTKLPRIAISLPPHVYETIKRMSDLGGEPMSRIVADLIAATAEPLMRTVALLEAAADAPKQVKDGLRQTVADMERELYGVVGYTIAQVDWLTGEFGKAPSGGAVSHALAGRAAAPPGSDKGTSRKPKNTSRKRDADPPVVTRGSGLPPAKKIKDLAKPKKGAKHG